MPHSQPSADSHPQRTEADLLRRDLRVSTADGTAFAMMVGVGETYLPAFVLAIGLGEVFAGLTATVPMLAGALLQLLSPPLLRRLGSRKRWVVLCSAIQAAVFLPLIVAAVIGHVPRPVVLLIAAFYWGTGMAAGAVWYTWIGRLVPAGVWARFFARRNRLTQAGQLAGMLAGGAVLQWAATRGVPLSGFVCLFTAALCFRAASVGFLFVQREPADIRAPDRTVSAFGLLGRLAKPEGRLLMYMLSVQVTAQLAGPFFTPYLLGELKLEYLPYVVILATFFLAKVVTFPWLGRFAHRFGARRLLWIGGLGIIPLAACWLVSASVPYLIAVQAVAGIAWACYELGTFLLTLQIIPDRERTSILTLFNLVNAAAIVTGAATGGAVLRLLGEEKTTYLILFALSSAARLLTLPLLRRVNVARPPAATVAA